MVIASGQLFVKYAGVPEWSIGADCKSAGVRLRRIKSFPRHHILQTGDSCKEETNYASIAQR